MDMELEIASGVLTAIADEAARSAQHEICGLLFGTDRRIAARLSCTNVAAQPRLAFEIDPTQLLAAHRAERAGGPHIVGCYHSHPGGIATPSARDADAAVPDGRIWLIVAGGRIGCYRAVADGAHHARFDAVSYRSAP